MKPVYQQRENAQGQRGDCLRAALASIFEVPYESVPPFEDMGRSWHEAYFKFLEARGYEYGGVCALSQAGEHDAVRGYLLVSGMSPRNPSLRHSVVYGLNGNMVHDPHPSGAGILEPIEVTSLLRKF